MSNNEKCIRKGCGRRKAAGSTFQACSSLCRRISDMIQEATNLATAFPSDLTDKYFQEVTGLNRLVNQSAESRFGLRKMWREAGLDDALWDQVTKGDWVPETLTETAGTLVNASEHS